MKINTNNSINFNGKPPKLVTADKALRLMNAHYPTASSTRYRKFNVAKDNSKLLQNIACTVATKCALLRRHITNVEREETAFDFFSEFLDIAENWRLSNCFELVKLFNFIMDLNGVESKQASLLPSEIDHCVALIPLKEDCFEKTDFSETPISKMKNFLIADPWLGVVDYAPKMATLYKHHPDFNRCVGSPEDYENWDSFVLKFRLEDYYLRPENYHRKNLTPEDKKNFATSHPELFIDKKELIKH